MPEEILWGSNIPQQVLKPEYWDGHSIEDDCSWVDKPQPNYRAFKADHKIYERRWEAAWKASNDFAQDFWEKKTSVALSEFRGAPHLTENYTT